MYIESWNLYFPEDQYTMFNESVNIITQFKEAFKDKIEKGKMDLVAKTHVFEISFDEFLSAIEDETKKKNFNLLILCLSCAISEIMNDKGYGIFKIKSKIVDFNKTSQSYTIDAESVGKLVVLLGTVCRIGFKRILIQKAFFECTKCHEIIDAIITKNIYKPPKKCKGNCKSKNFTFLYDHPQTYFRDVQDIKVQILGNNDDDSKCSIKESIIECLIYDDLVGSLAPGDVIRLCGVIDAESESDSLYKLVVVINNLVHVKNKIFYADDSGCSTEDFNLFKRISKTPNIISTLIHSLYPDIYGHELIKTGLVLALFGGTKKYVGQSISRSEIHVLIVGDPGLGKSRLLLESCNVLPKSTYISGSFTTTTGLTVSIVHDASSGDYMIDAGALVVSDSGVCCIDEFDKIDDHSALNEAMEDQKVTVAKGGVVCSVPTKTTIIAASNPKNGHFDKSRTIKENLKFDTTLLTRFDMIFVLLDNLNEQENYEISEQILKKKQMSTCDNLHSSNPFKEIISTIRDDKFIGTLKRNDGTVLYFRDKLRKYISYARACVFPTLSSAAKNLIRNYYLCLRDKSGVTTRDLESLIRIAEARAKIELRSIATQDDAQFSIDLYKRILIKENKEQPKKRNSKQFVNLLIGYFESNEIKSFTKNELGDFLKDLRISNGTDEVIDVLSHRGLLLKLKDGNFKFIG